MYYNWHRFYDPESGRYVTADPIGLAGGMNLFAYVENNPVNWVDPWGLVSVGQLGIGNPGSHGGENTCESMYDEGGLWGKDVVDYEYNYSHIPITLGAIEPLGVGKLLNIQKIAQGANIRKLEQLIKKWGGRGKDWKKMKGWDKNGQEWHWYQKRGDGTKYGIKQKGDLDPF